MRRAMAVVAAAVLVVCLAGCSSATVTGFTRSDAQADAAKWTSQAIGAIASAPANTTRFNGYERCRSDTGFFTSSSQWHTITNVTVPLAKQLVATNAIAAAFEAEGWKRSGTSALTTLRGPAHANRTGVILIQTDGDHALSISVVSPCYA